MTDERFLVNGLSIQDVRKPKGITYLLDKQGGVNALCNLINGMSTKSERLERENEQLRQFKQTVFDLLDKKIKRNEEGIKWGEEMRADTSAMSFYNYMLKELKMELLEWQK